MHESNVTLDFMAWSCWFSYLDLCSSYWQPQLALEEHPKTTRSCSQEFRVMLRNKISTHLQKAYLETLVLNPPDSLCRPPYPCCRLQESLDQPGGCLLFHPLGQAVPSSQEVSPFPAGGILFGSCPHCSRGVHRPC